MTKQSLLYCLSRSPDNKLIFSVNVGTMVGSMSPSYLDHVLTAGDYERFLSMGSIYLTTLAKMIRSNKDCYANQRIDLGEKGGAVGCKLNTPIDCLAA